MKLNLGCFNDIKEGYVNLDKGRFNVGVDVIHDLENFPYPFKDNTFKKVYARCILEHISVNKRVKVLSELHRICKDKAIIHIEVSYKDKIFRSIDHKGGGFDFYTFPNLCSQKDYVMKERFELVNQSSRPTQIGKLFPSWVRQKLSYFVNEIVENIIAELRVCK